LNGKEVIEVEVKGLAKTFYNVQKLRIILSNTLRHSHSWHPYLHELMKEVEMQEKRLEELCQKAVQESDVYTVFLKKVKGVGPIMAAYLLDYFDIRKADHVSSFWQFAGLAPGCRRKRGEKVNYNPALKTIILGRLFTQLQMAKGYYHKLYRHFRAELEAEHPEWAKDRKTIGKYHARARLKTMKVFLQHLWVVWRKLEGLNITKPYSADRLGHAYIEPPLDQETI